MISVKNGLKNRFVTVLLFLAYILQSKVIANSDELPPKVSTHYGEVEGIWKFSYEGHQYAVFEGIPYAKPPIGDLRFEKPQPITSWNGTRKATKVNKCIQRDWFDRKKITGEEDCLYLNVYVPRRSNSSRKLDVVVHIHGGGFTVGYGSEYTNEKYIMDRNVIFVTMHYRLAALGFLSTGDDVVPGNNGLKDQTLALKWIKENIENFGGNPNSITLTGFSAGAVSVHLHYFSPLSQKLFNKGMSLSGTALNRFSLQINPEKRAKMLAKTLNCETTNNTIMIDCLKSRPAHLIIEELDESDNPFPPIPNFLFAPVIEKESKYAFLSKHPYELLKNGDIYDVPWITSVTTHEGFILSMPSLGHYDEIDKNWTQLAKYLFHYDETIQQLNESEIAQKIRNFYLPGGEKIDETKYEELTQIWTDRELAVDAYLAAEMQARLNKSAVYFYEFGYDSHYGLKTKWGKSKYKGVGHGDDMAYFFGGMISKQLSTDEIKLKNIGLDILYSYAHEGKPYVPNLNWLPLGREFHVLHIDGPNNIKLQTKTNFESRLFWKSLGLLENANLFLD